MLRRLILVVALLLALPAAAKAASFDCKKAASRAEKVICANRELSQLDETMAAAYAKALTVWDGKLAAGTRLNQRGWVGSRALLPPEMGQGGILCFDDAERITCLRAAYKDRIAVLGSPAWPLGGIYERGKDMLRVKVTPGGLDFAYQIDGPAYASGATDESKPVAVSTGVTRVVFPLMGEGRDACRLTGDFTAEAVVLAQTGPCGGARLSGRWTRNQARDPEAELF